MKNDNTILILLAGVAIYYIWKQNNQVPVNKIKAAGLFTKDAIKNSEVFIPNDSFAKQYKNDQAKCV
jgi:hypothetical protein